MCVTNGRKLIQLRSFSKSTCTKLCGQQGKTCFLSFACVCPNASDYHDNYKLKLANSLGRFLTFRANTGAPQLPEKSIHIPPFRCIVFNCMCSCNWSLSWSCSSCVTFYPVRSSRFVNTSGLHTHKKTLPQSFHIILETQVSFVVFTQLGVA